MTGGSWGDLEHIHYTHHTRLRYAFAFIGKDTQLFNWKLWYFKTARLLHTCRIYDRRLYECNALGQRELGLGTLPITVLSNHIRLLQVSVQLRRDSIY